MEGGEKGVTKKVAERVAERLMGHILSLLQHMRQTQPGSPLRPTRTERLLDYVSVA